MNRDFRAKAREMSADSINDRLVELAQAVTREPNRANVYRQQAQLLREELQRRGDTLKQFESRFNNIGTRQPEKF